MNQVILNETHYPFNPILEKDEKILWSAKPNLTVFISTGIPFLAIGLCWAAFDYYTFNNVDKKPEMLVFMLLHLAPFYLSILNMFRLAFIYGNTRYAVTNRRLLLRGGFWGIDCKSIDFDKIQSLEVNVNPLENILKVGTIRIQLSTFGYNNKMQAHNFVGIESPYEAFKKIKEASSESKESQVIV